MVNRWSGSIFSFFAVGLVVVVIFAFLDLRQILTVKYAPVVKINSGKIRGVVTGKDDGLYLYQAIRYGQATRFSKPVPAEPWFDIYDAIKWRAACPQFGAPMDQNWQKNWSRIESEDCLFLSVWKPVVEKANRSVMIWIHGGAFEMGSIQTTDHDCQYLAQQGDVIVVSINYRLGPLGFLYGGSDYTGNWGLHDQILALEWVKENIHVFGGNPKDVTVFGESAGSMSIGALLLMTQTKGLFHRAIMQSGSPTATTEPFSEGLKKSQKLAAAVKCPISDPKKMVKCLKAKSFKELQIPLYGDLQRNEYFTPVYGDELLPKSAVELVKEIKLDVDLMFGVMRDEGSIFVEQFAPAIRSKNLTIEMIKSETAKLMDKMKQSNHRSEIAEFYTKNLMNPTQDDLRIAISNALGDLLFVCHEILFTEQIARNAPNKKYFAFRLMQKPDNHERWWQPWMGVVHATDNEFIFIVPATGCKNKATRQLSRDMIQAWTTFAKTGNPGQIGGVKWDEAFNDKLNPSTRFMSLKYGKYKNVDGYFVHTCEQFWKKLIFA